MKKLCVITTISGTMESFVIPAMLLFVEKGYDVTLICNMTTEFIEKYSSKFHCINLPMKRGISLKDMLLMPFKFYTIFKKEKFDYIQYATPNASLYASIAAKLIKCPIRLYCQWGIRYVGANGLKRKILKQPEHLTCALSTHIRPASQKNLEFAVSEGLYKKEKANIIGKGGTIGVDLQKFNSDDIEKNKEIFFRKYPDTKDKIIFCFVGRLNPDKGVFELLRAFQQLKKALPNIVLLLVGNSEGKLPDDLKNVRNSKDIIFTGYTSNVPLYLSVANTLVHPSYREGFSMVIQQAMAMKIPVITTNIPGPSEVIEEGISGLLVPPRNIERLKDAMEYMANHPIQRKKMGESGLERVKKYFTREKMLQKTYEDRVTILK